MLWVVWKKFEKSFSITLLGVCNSWNYFLFISAVLNIAVAYTSRDEITQAIKEVANGLEKGMIKERLGYWLFLFSPF